MKYWMRYSRYFFLLTCFFLINSTSLLAQSILVLTQSNKAFSNNLIKQITIETTLKHSHVKIIKQNIIDQPEIENISEHDLIITLGNKPAKFILNKKTNNPVLSLLITKRAIKLLNKTYNPKHPWSTISLDQPINRQFLLIKHLLGKNSAIGTIFGPVSQKNKSRIFETAKKLSLKLTSENTLITDQLISALKSLTSRSDVILAIPDPVTFNRKTIGGILLLTYRKNIPVIGFSKSYVKAGALAAVYSSPDQISQQAAEIINNFIETNTINKKNHEPKYFSIEINKKIAHTLNIKTKSNTKIIQLIKHDEGSK
jgi:ABC-type uncharacterized transport system substrate-binding protein